MNFPHPGAHDLSGGFRGCYPRLISVNPPGSGVVTEVAAQLRKLRFPNTLYNFTIFRVASAGQSCAPAGDLPGSQWKAFTSLAIAGGGRGPIFAATLVPCKGGVLATSASGVWGCDYTGAVRALFRTGDTNIIAGKTLKSFTLLNATVGSLGVTRSFNDAAQVVWLATFADKTTAIVTTQVP